MSKEKQIEEMSSEIFGILSSTMNGANFDDLHEATYKIIRVANYRKQINGEWTETDDENGYESYRCSNCGCEQVSKSNYCPDCGAKMKGGAE